MFVLFIAVQIICCVAAFITCGMANNMYAENKKAETFNSFNFMFETNTDEYEHFQEVFQLDENGKLEYF